MKIYSPGVRGEARSSFIFWYLYPYSELTLAVSNFGRAGLARSSSIISFTVRPALAARTTGSSWMDPKISVFSAILGLGGSQTIQWLRRRLSPGPGLQARNRPNTNLNIGVWSHQNQQFVISLSLFIFSFDFFGLLFGWSLLLPRDNNLNNNKLFIKTKNWLRKKKKNFQKFKF